MSEENNQSQELEQNNVEKSSEDKQDWKKTVAIVLAVLLLGILLIYVMVHSVNRKNEIKKADNADVVEQRLMEAANSGMPVEGSMTYHSETEENGDDNHTMRIEDYEMKYKGKFFDPEFEKRFEKRKEIPEIELITIDKSSVKPVVINSNLKDDTMIINVEAENYSDDDIKYEFGEDNIKIYGATQIMSIGKKKDISFSETIYLPAPPKKDEVQIKKDNGQLIYLIPLDIDAVN